MPMVGIGFKICARRFMNYHKTLKMMRKQQNLRGFGGFENDDIFNLSAA